MNKLASSFRESLLEIRSFGKNGLSLQRRSFTFFILFLFAVMSGLLLILFSTGAFSVGLKECHVFLKNELGHIAGDVSREFGTLSIEGVSLAKRLAEQIEKRLKANGLTPSELKNNPRLLEQILSESVEQLIIALEKNKSSGAFLVLNATINPRLKNAEHSRAGLFLKNMEPNVINLSTPTIRFLRGPASIARQKHLYLLPQWQMEFTVETGDFFFTTMNAAAGSNLPLSRLYYWNPSCALAGDYEKAMLLCVPLISSDGVIIGVCGFEVSAMLFKLKNIPDNSTYTRAFTMLTPIQRNTLDASKAMYAGNYSAIPLQIGGTLSIKALGNGISSYITPDGSAYSGLHQKINLYPKNAAFSGNEWALAVLIPEQDLMANIMRQNRRILVLLFILLIFSVGAAVLFSRKNIEPVVGALEMVKTNQISKYEKTNIHEIDDLFAFLASRDEPGDTSAPSEDTTKASALYNAFVKNIKTLSPAERSVFNLYMEGYTAQEITKILCLSINTIKTHNKRIYTKLNVSSRKELLVYVKMMKEKDGILDGEE
ncbi:MAG: helix-turn-helix domain-containing protein [Bacteroidota bacterium]